MAVFFTDTGEAQTVVRLQASAGAPTYFVGVGTGAGGASKTSTTLSTEVETRASATPTVQTTGSTGDTLRLVGTQTMGSARVVTNGAAFDASTSGNMYAISDGLSISLGAGDSLQQTFNLQFT
jgi:hypothetical protein